MSNTACLFAHCLQRNRIGRYFLADTVKYTVANNYCPLIILLGYPLRRRYNNLINQCHNRRLKIPVNTKNISLLLKLNISLCLLGLRVYTNINILAP